MNKHEENRKYSIIDSETKEYLDDVKNNGISGLCFNKFKADFVFDSKIKDLKISDKICIDGIEMIITKIGKECYPSNCELFKRYNKTCKLKDGVAFAK